MASRSGDKLLKLKQLKRSKRVRTPGYSLATAAVLMREQMEL
jgi:hypothetical protein